ncbi:MAG: hypothetical protein LC737_02660, partial [Chloroflexi bacterium]|nr:hypothetical protein [Chloroflexota bacterium]
GAEDDVARELEAMLDTVSKFLAQGDAFNAAAIYHAIADEVLEHYEQFADESGELGGVVNDCATGLGECLQAITDEGQWREDVLRALFDIYHFDVEFGGVGLSDEAPDIIAKHATRDERKQIVGWTRAAMKESRGDSWSANWQRQVYGGFLAKLQADMLDDEAYLQLCRETGRLNDLVDRLLALKRVDQAVTEANETSDYELLQLAEVLAQHKQGDMIEPLVRARLPKTEDSRLLEWLMQRYAVRGDITGALGIARQLFTRHASLASYEEVQKLAEQIAQWSRVRAELLAECAEKKDWQLLTLVHLKEKNYAEAWQAVGRISDRFSLHTWGEDLSVTLAQASEESYPREALNVYLRKVEQFIGERNRGAYQQACEYLRYVRQVYRRLGEEAMWQKYLAKLREQHKSLRALHDEMSKAKIA